MKTAERVTYNNGTNSVIAVRQSNQTLLITNDTHFPDSDSIILEDKRGHRYVRNIELEQFIQSDDKIYEII